MTEIRLDEDIASELVATQKLIASEFVYKTIVDELCSGTRNTPAQLSCLDALEQSIAVFRTASLQLRKGMDVLTLEARLSAAQQAQPTPAEVGSIQQTINDAVFFSNRYALHLAGKIGLELLQSQPANVSKKFSFGGKYDTSKDRDVLSKCLARITNDDLRYIIDEKRKAQEDLNDECLLHTLEAVFTTWANQFRWESWKEIAQKHNAQEITLAYDRFSIKEGNFKQQHSQVRMGDFKQCKAEDVISPGQLGAAIEDALVGLSFYNHEKRSNPDNVPFVMFVYGAPGCGKTFTAHAYIQSFAEMCKLKGKALWARTHSVTDYASHYQNLTANRLREFAEEIIKFPGMTVVYVSDADTIFQTRKNPHMTAEAKNTLDVYMRMFDGTLIPKNGKVLWIMDANFIDGIDDALKSRIFDKIINVERWQEKECFALYARRLICKGSQKEPGVDWDKVGQYLLESQLSNREIDNVITGLRQGTQRKWAEMGQEYNIRVKRGEEHLASLTTERIIAAFGAYVAERVSMDIASREALVSEDVGRFLNNLSKQPPGETKNEPAE